MLSLKKFNPPSPTDSIARWYFPTPTVHNQQRINYKQNLWLRYLLEYNNFIDYNVNRTWNKSRSKCEVRKWNKSRGTWMLRERYVKVITWYVNGTWMERDWYVFGTWIYFTWYVIGTWMERECISRGTWMYFTWYVNGTWTERETNLVVREWYINSNKWKCFRIYFRLLKLEFIRLPLKISIVNVKSCS